MACTSPQRRTKNLSSRLKLLLTISSFFLVLCLFSLRINKQIVLVAYMAVLGYLATRALRQVPRTTSASPSGFIGMTDTRIVYDTKKDQCRHPQPADVVDTPEGSFDV